MGGAKGFLEIHLGPPDLAEGFLALNGFGKSFRTHRAGLKDFGFPRALGVGWMAWLETLLAGILDVQSTTDLTLWYKVPVRLFACPDLYKSAR